MERYIIKANKIIARNQLEAMESSGLLIENGKIQKVYDNISQAEIPEQTNVIGYDDKIIIPGMIDYHSRLALDARLENHLVKMEDYEAEQAIRAIKTIKDDLAAGVAASRRLGDKFYIDVTYKKVQKEGRIAGPKLVVSGISMRSSHGHGYVGMPHCGTEDFRRASREDIARDIDFLKVFMTRVINATPSIYHFSTLEELRAVAGGARNVNITTVCHCSGRRGLDDCLITGIDRLERMYYIIQPRVKRVKEEDHWMVYTPNYALNDQLSFKFPPHDREGSLREKGIICKCLSGAIEGGFKFSIDTDGLHQGLAQETCYISGPDTKNRDILAGITINAARICGASRSTGSIAERKVAGFTVLEDNPLDDIETLERVTSVIQGGTIIF